MPSAPPRSYDYVIGLGANLGSRRANLATAVERLADFTQVTRISALYESEPWGPPQPLYLNAAVRVATDLAPEALLARALAIEAELGRTRDPALRYGPRTLDLDLLWSTETRAGDGLTLPHPRLHERWFALAPLLDVADELAPLYADALAAAGGRRAPRAPQLETEPVAAIARAPSELRARANAPEIEDALADAMTALGRELAGSSLQPPGQLQIESIAAHTPAVLVEQALARVASGLALARAIVTRLDGAACEGRLFGRRTSQPVPLRLQRFLAMPEDRGVTVEIAVSV
jgi:2-amino-4-hydroxy-6-hydroxymethyldihydropteridine diphosphokinase